MEMLDKVKIELDNFSVSDDLINRYIEKCTTIAKDTCHYSVLPTNIEEIVIDTVVECINKRENEGVLSKSALGVSTTFAYKDIEESLKAKLKNLKNPMALVGKW